MYEYMLYFKKNSSGLPYAKAYKSYSFCDRSKVKQFEMVSLIVIRGMCFNLKYLFRSFSNESIFQKKSMAL